MTGESTNPEGQVEGQGEGEGTAAASERPEWLPEKFWTAEGPSYENLAKSYGELERMGRKPIDEFKAEWEAERLAARPEAADKYALPEIDILDGDAMAASPIVAAFRDIAFTAGMSQEQFNAGIESYAKAEASRLEAQFEREMTALGENAKVRAEAVGLWARKTFGEGDKLAAIEQVCTTAAGVEAIEQVMAALRDNGGEVENDLDGNDGTDTKEVIDALMQKPEYWDSKRRDPTVVARVERFFQRQYGKS